MSSIKGCLPSKVVFHWRSTSIKLRYVGVSREYLIDIYILIIRSDAEYCSVSFPSYLTQEQSNKQEGIQRTCLKSALEIFGLETLENRRNQTCLDFCHSTSPQLKSWVWHENDLTPPTHHHHHKNSMSSISQLFLTRF